MTDSLIQKLEALKVDGENGFIVMPLGSDMMDAHNYGVQKAIDIIRQHYAEQVMGGVEANGSVPVASSANGSKGDNLASPASPSEISINEAEWPENIAAERHEVSKKWVLHYLTDAQAKLCKAALKRELIGDTTGTVWGTLWDALDKLIDDPIHGKAASALRWLDEKYRNAKSVLEFDEISIDVSTGDNDANLRAFAVMPPREVMEHGGKHIALFDGYLNNDIEGKKR